MSNNNDGFKPCNVCTRACFMTHRHQVQAEMMLVCGAPSFFQQIGVDQLHDTTGFLPVPTRFLVDYGSRLRDVVTWRGPSGWVGQVNLSYYDTSYGFRGGWQQFRYYHNIEAGDHLVCTMIADSDFVIKIYDKHGCEKALPFLNSPEAVLPATEKNTENAFPFEIPSRSSFNHGIENSTPKLGEKRGISISEDRSLSGMLKKLCTQQPDLGDTGTGSGAFDNLKNENQNRSEMKLDSTDGDSPVEMEEEGKPNSENVSTLFSEKSPEMEDSDVTTKEMEIRHAIYEAQVTNPLSTALRAARAHTTANPSTICVVNKTAASKSQSYISSKFARRWLPAVKTQLLLKDELDRKWPVIFIPKSYHVVLSAGWAKFVRDNSLESGDVVLMELKEPNSLSLVVHIFREENRTSQKTSSTVDNGLLSTGSYMDDLSVGRTNGEQTIGTSEVDTTESSPPPLLPQYAAVAKYFASRGPPMFDSNQNAGTASTCAVDPRQSNEAEKAAEGAEVVPPGVGTASASQQGGSPTTRFLHERVSVRPGSVGNRAPLFQQQTFQGATASPRPPGAAIPLPDISYPPRAPPQHFHHVRPALLKTPLNLPIPPIPPLTSEQVLMPNFTPTQSGGGKASAPSEVEPPSEEQSSRPQDKWEVQPRRAREPTEVERRRAMEQALEFWTPNPHVISTLRPSQVYNGFSINLRSNALPNETQDATLLDSTGKSWVCKWLVNASGKRLSAGWKRFALDHLLEEGDVCVFEVVGAESLTMLVHVFRVELDDSIVGLEEVKPILPPTKKKRIRVRKSRAKVRFGRPPEDVPEGGGVPSQGTLADALPNASSPKGLTFQSQRRSVTLVERKRAELAARALTTANPSVVVVLTRSSVYCHFTVSIPSVFARQWLPKKLVGVTLLDAVGQRSTARWAGNRKSSACLKGFKAFSRTHRLEEGDTLVFELMDPNPDNLIFLVHTFRVVAVSSGGCTSSQAVDSNDASQLLTDSEDDSDSSPMEPTAPPAGSSKAPWQNAGIREENGEFNFLGKGFCATALPLAVRMPKPEPSPPGGPEARFPRTI